MKSKAASGWTFTSKNVAKGHVITSTDPSSTAQNWPMPDSGSPCMPKRWNPTGLAKSQGPPNVRMFFLGSHSHRSYAYGLPACPLGLMRNWQD